MEYLLTIRMPDLLDSEDALWNVLQDPGIRSDLEHAVRAELVKIMEAQDILHTYHQTEVKIQHFATNNPE